MRLKKTSSSTNAISKKLEANENQAQAVITNALADYRSVQAWLPADADVHYKIAKTLRLMGKNDDAEAAYCRVIALEPAHTSALNDYADLLRDTGHKEQAISMYQTVLLHDAGNTMTYNSLGMTLQSMGQLDLALIAYREILARKPNNAMAYNNIGSIQQIQGRLEEAMQSFRLALDIDQNYIPAHFNISVCLMDMGRYEESLVSAEKVLQMDSGHLQTHTNISAVLFALGRNDEAIKRCRLALVKNADWEYLYSNLLFLVTHDGQLSPAEIFADHLSFGKQFEEPLRALWPRHTNDRDPDRRLRIGFVSADLYGHAVANFITPILDNLCHAPGLEIFAYANSKRDDAISQHLQTLVSVWRQVEQLSNDELARLITDDAIDILIDLSGHTGHNRLLTFARKPAPLQASWIGYPATTGLQSMDYYLSDRFFSPPGLFDDQFTEKLVFLPACAPFLPSPDAPLIEPLPARKNGFITFGSFNRASKLRPKVIARWSELLRAIPNAKMIVAAMPDIQVIEKLKSWFANEGISFDRLSFHARTNTRDYLALHHLVDVCLDTFPYTGGTTTYHALWMGVPTLTMTGLSLSSRATTAINLQTGLGAFVAHDDSDFVSKGLQISSDIAYLTSIRTNMRERVQNSMISQSGLIASGLESALRTMWRRWCAHLPAVSFESSVDQTQPQRRSLEVNSQQEMNIDAAILLAIEHHQANRYVEAETLYLAILNSHPKHAIANHNMGLLAGQLGFHNNALPYLHTAVMTDPAEAQFCLSYAQGLLEAGHARQALEILEEAHVKGIEHAAVQILKDRVHSTLISESRECTQLVDVPFKNYQSPETILLTDDTAAPPKTDAAIYANLPKMNISTEDDFAGVSDSHPFAKQFLVLTYADGTVSTLPHNFFRNWLDEEPQNGSFYIGRCSGLGVGSLVKYDSGAQSLCIGRYVAGGLRLRFLLNGQHEMRTISTSMFSVQGMGLRNAPPPQYTDSIIKNDVWIGDEVMMLGGGIIENGCVIGARSLLPPNFRSEPYGIYAGSPARLIRFRFSEKVRAALLDLAWWEMPLSWLQENNDYFLLDMTAPDEQVLPIIEILRASRGKFMAEAAPATAI